MSRGNIIRRIVIAITVCTVLYFAMFPLYVKWIAGNYARKFAEILNSHDMERYDEFFSKDTIFELNGKQIQYADAKENIEKVQTFTSKGSYGHLEEWFDFKEFIMDSIKKEYRVFLMLPISGYQDGENMCIEAEIILERKCIFFFAIEKVIFDEEGGERERFLKDFWGIGK